METIERNTVKTRKSHVCFACWRKHPKGTEMTLEKIAIDGRIDNLYACKTCVALMDEFEEKLIDPVDLLFWERCVEEDLKHYPDLQTPEELLEHYRTECQAAK